jgi:hypothetical protein
MALRRCWNTVYALGVLLLVSAAAFMGCGKNDGSDPVSPTTRPPKPEPVGIVIKDYAYSHIGYYRNGDTVVITERDSLMLETYACDADGNKTDDTVSLSIAGNVPCQLHTWKTGPYNSDIRTFLVAGSLPNTNQTMATGAMNSEVISVNKQPLTYKLTIIVAKRYIYRTAGSSFEIWNLYYWNKTVWNLSYDSYLAQMGDSVYDGWRLRGQGTIRQNVFTFKFTYTGSPDPTSWSHAIARFDQSMDYATGWAYLFNGDSTQIRWVRQ